MSSSSPPPEPTPGLWAEPPPPGASYTPGVDSRWWHAIDPDCGGIASPPADGAIITPGSRWLSLCELPVVAASKWNSFAAVRATGNLAVCPSCIWLVAIRSGHVDSEIARLGAAGAGAPGLVGGVSALARTIVDAATASHADYELDHPRTVGLLTTLARHAPETLVDVECAEGCCEHRYPAAEGPAAGPLSEDTAACPTVGWACPTCSLRAGSWAGEWEGQYEPDGIVAPPCSVLGAVMTLCAGVCAEPLGA